MRACRRVQESLPELLMGRGLPGSGEVERHLACCEECRQVRRELEAVFALLERSTGPSEPPYGEANARLALRSAGAPGPLRANELRRRREDLRLGLCSVLSLAGMGGLVTGTLAAGGVERALQSAAHWLHALPVSPQLWPGALALGAAAGLVALLPALALGPQPAARRRRTAKRA